VWDVTQVEPLGQDQGEAQEEGAAATDQEPEAIPTAPARLDVACEKVATPTNSLAAQSFGKREPVALHILAVLQAAYFEGDKIVLPTQLERKTYLDTNKVLERIGGKWNRKQKGHVFEDEEN